MNILIFTLLSKRESTCTSAPLPVTEGAKGCGAQEDPLRNRYISFHPQRSDPRRPFVPVIPATACLGGKVTVGLTIWLTHARKPDPLLYTLASPSLRLALSILFRKHSSGLITNGSRDGEITYCCDRSWRRSGRICR